MGMKKKQVLISKSKSNSRLKTIICKNKIYLSIILLDFFTVSFLKPPPSFPPLKKKYIFRQKFFLIKISKQIRELTIDDKLAEELSYINNALSLLH